MTEASEATLGRTLTFWDFFPPQVKEKTVGKKLFRASHPAFPLLLPGPRRGVPRILQQRELQGPASEEGQQL